MNLNAPFSALDPERLPKPFSVGLSAMNAEDWLLVDVHHVEQVREKQRLLDERRDQVFQARPDTVQAQAELAELVSGFLQQKYPQAYERQGNTLHIHPAGISLDMPAYEEAPLELAARIAQEDFVIMRKGPQGYYMAAAAVCFPSTWVLADKFGKAIADIHQPVPGFGRGTRPASVIDRIFDNLKCGQPVERCNWSFYEVPDLFHAERHSSHTRWQESGDGFLLAGWLRAERQTLMRLPESGDVVFTIRITVDAMAELLRHPQRNEIAQRLCSHLESMDVDELAYKGLAEHREQVIGELRRLGGIADE
jgi:hypothetical protein